MEERGQREKPINPKKASHEPMECSGAGMALQLSLSWSRGLEIHLYPVLVTLCVCYTPVTLGKAIFFS